MPDIITSGPMNITYSTAAVNSIDGGMLLFMLLMVGGAVLIMLMLTSLERYTRFFQYLGKWISSLKYTLAGGGLVTAGYGIYLACGMLARAGSGIDPIWILEGIGVYIGLTVLGWVGTRVVQKARNMHNAYVAAKKGEGIEVTAHT